MKKATKSTKTKSARTGRSSVTPLKGTRTSASKQRSRTARVTTKRPARRKLSKAHKISLHLLVVLAAVGVFLFGFIAYRNWQIERADATSFSVVSGSGKCLDNRGGAFVNENPIQLYTCNTNPNSQGWLYANNTLSIKDYCLDVPGAGKQVGLRLWLYKCNGTVAQVWVAQSNGRLMNPNSGLCLDNEANRTVNGNPIQIYTCNTTAAQKWTMKAPSGTTPSAPLPPLTNTTPLPFNQLSNATLKAFGKKVFAHYFTPYPIQIDNVDFTTDYYTKGYLSPSGEGGKHAAYGGLLRDRPLPQPVGGATWDLDNMKTEVRRATQAGIDGFTVDILGTSGYNWDRFKLLLKAAPLVDSSFKIVLMPDNGGSGVTQGPDAFAAAMASVAKDPAIFKLNDGRLVVSPFRAEGSIKLSNGTTMSGLAFWTRFNSVMKSKYGITVALVPCFLDYGNNAAGFAPISYGFSNWGNRSPGSNSLTALTNLSKDAHARGKIWMQPVSVQDSRPNGGSYWEANNSENLRATWEGAIAGADWVQIPTWNDYSENAQIAPSAKIGWSLLDLNAYYLSRFKVGAAPIITKDVLYVSHRVQPYAALPTGGQTKLQVNKTPTQTPSRDKVEVLAFLRQAGTIQVTVGATTSTVNAPAGISSHLFDLKTGTISAKVTVNGAVTASVTSPFKVTSAPVVQDLHYHFVSSARDNNGLGDYSDSMVK